MFDQIITCPYTGLRSFTEEEAIFFKGRDGHIEEATKQLEQRKFLMLTGASGDGKSSLVYAGVVPYARAGFLKSHFSNWVVADFKPERAPFANLCRSLSKNLDISSLSSVEAELSYGFSSLVEIYKNSKYYHDKNSKEWLEADDNKKQELRRSSANLLVLADQFEEFFTNDENYFNGAVSQKSNLVVNLLLETARIAKRDNLPIYVVCTMRSDYIGQCAAFRGLPEFIGYSQFFVPRLNRVQLLEAIEEPAILSGNVISKRLVERLIYDITEGIDQLPILQHALNQIWRAADNGKDEMDLLHYAMVGGLSASDLPDEDQVKFASWLSTQNKKVQGFYSQPSMHNVLNTHANKLHATIAEVYNTNNEDQISDEDAQHIIHNTLVCLTKVDHARAVRNRMTLREIRDITDIEGITTEKVRKLTAVFRDPSNTLIQPFIDENGNDPLGDDDILDISHESLIRNWSQLSEWVEVEYDHVNTYRDFKQQVDRWVQNKNSSDFLLPIGTLSHFEDWFAHIKPNKYWINRYYDELENKSARLERSEEILNTSRTFLKQSANNHRITRTVMKLGAKKIATAFLLLAFLVFSSFYVYEEYSKSNNVVLGKIMKEGIDHLSDKDISLGDKVNFTIGSSRVDSSNWDLIFESLEAKNAYLLSLGIATDVFNRMEYRQHPLLEKSITQADSLLSLLYPGKVVDSLSNDYLKDHNDIIRLLSLIQYIHTDPIWQLPLKKYTESLADYLLKELAENPNFIPDAIRLNDAIQHCLNNKAWTPNEIKEILSYLSPLEGQAKPVVAKNYALGISIGTESSSASFEHGGLYQELGYLYASVGDLDKVVQCIDSLLKYKDGYYTKDYNTQPDNGTNIAAYFLTNGHEAVFDQFVKIYSNKSGISQLDFLDQMAARSHFTIFESNKHVFEEREDYMKNHNFGLLGEATRDQVFFRYKNEIEQIKDPVAREFKLALYYKHLGINIAQKQVLQSGSFNKENVFPLYDQAIAHYKKVPVHYLNGLSSRGSWGGRLTSAKRKEQFLYPGYMEYQIIWIPRAYPMMYSNISFMEYMTEKENVNDYYTEKSDLNIITEWHSIYTWGEAIKLNFIGQAELNWDVVYDFYQELKLGGLVSSSELTQLKVKLCNYYFSIGNEDRAKSVLKDLATDYLDSSMPDIFPFLSTIKFKRTVELSVLLKQKGLDDDFENFVKAFERPENKANLLAFVAKEMTKVEEFDTAIELLERAKIESKLVTEGFQSQKMTIVRTLGSFPDLKYYKEVRALWKNLLAKNFIDLNLAEAHSFHGFAWRAYQDIDPMTETEVQLRRFSFISKGMNRIKQSSDPVHWKIYDVADPIWWDGLNYAND